MSKRKRADDYIDDGPIDQLSKILNSNDIEPNLLEFLDKGLYRQVIQIWSYYGQISDHDKLEATTIVFEKFLKILDFNSSFIKYGVDIIRLIMDEYMKIIYRCLFLVKPGITTSILNIMKQITIFNQGMLVPDFFSAFDFSIKIIPKLLSSNQGGFRDLFLQFYLSFIQNGTYLVRKDLICQKKVISGWFKYMNELDSEDLIVHSLDTFITCILKEPAFLKSTKLSFLNDWVLRQMIKLFSHKSDVVKSKTAEFLEILTTNKTYGIVFSENGWSNKKINNRAILIISKLLKPWEDIQQQDLLLKILRSCSELVSPYVSDLMESISFDPKVSSFWISLMTLLSRICELPVNEQQLLLFETPSIEIVLNNTLPFKKPALIKTFSHKSPFVRYLGCQLVIFGLRRFQRIKTIYDFHGWDFRSLLIEANTNRLPHSQVFTSVVSTTQNDLPLLKSVVLEMTKEYLNLYGEESALNSLPLAVDWTASNITGLQHIQIQTSIEIQMKLNAGEKWWKSVSGQKYSLFTSALSLAGSNDTFADEIIKLLRQMTISNILFQEQTLVHPVEILVNTVIQAKNYTPLLQLIEESVGRCMLSPYKYVDLFNGARNDDNAAVSPFLVTLMEQLQHSSDYDSTEPWIIKILRDSYICGEDQNSIIKLAKHYKLKHVDILMNYNMNDWKSLFPHDDYFDYILVSSEKGILNRKDLAYKMGIKMDLQATKYRILRSSTKLADHLFKSIPLDNVEFRKLLLDEGFFGDIILAGGEYASQYLEIVRSLNNTERLGDFLKRHNLISMAFWTLDDLSLVDLGAQSLSNAQACLPELVRRRARVSLDNIASLSRLADASSENLLCKLVQNNDFKGADGKNLKICEEQLMKGSHYAVLCALIKSSERLESHLNFVDVPEKYVVDLTVALIKHVPEKLDSIDTSRAFDAGVTLSTLPLYDIDRLRNDSKLCVQVNDFISNLQGSDILSLDVVHTIGMLYLLNNENPVVRKWFSQCILWLTKRFTEESRSGLSLSLLELLRALNIELSNINLWRIVGKKAINSWLESSINWLDTEEVLELATRVVFQAKQENQPIEHTKLLQLILNHESYSGNKHALLIWALFHCDAKENVGIQNDILIKMFQASPDPNDWLFLDILRNIERITETSWANNVISWSIRDDESDDFIISSRDGLEVVLDKRRILQNVKSFKREEWFELEQNIDFDNALNEIEKHRKIYVDSEERYNPAFLLFSIISSDIFEQDELNIRKLVDSNMLAFAVASLGSSKLSPVSKLIIQSLAQTDMSKYKDRIVINLLTGKLLTFISEQEAVEENRRETASCIYIMFALLINIMTSPGHFLYNSVCQFLLSGPSIKQEVIPLFDTISKTDSEMARREIAWLLDALTISLQTNEDIKLYLKKGIFEWALSLPEKLFGKEQGKLISKAQETPGGAFRLAAGTGGICWSDMRGDLKEKLRYFVTVPEKLKNWSGISPVYM